MKKTVFKYEILKLESIPLDNVHPNPLNPRPEYQMPDDDPEMVELAASIKADGQRRPGYVYEIPDRPGHYMILQGERRYRACHIAELDTYLANVVATPTSRVEELDWIAAEDSHHVNWGTYRRLRLCRDYATELGHNHMAHVEVQVKTGLSMEILRQGDKMFRLHPDIHTRVELYDEVLYMRRLQGKRGRVREAELPDIGEFSVVKAALVWDIFSLIREQYPTQFKELTDLELQERLAAKAGLRSGGAQRQLENLRSLLASRSDDPKLLGLIDDLIHSERRTPKAIVRAMGAEQASRLDKLMVTLRKLEDEAPKLATRVTQLGSSEMDLTRASRQIAKTVRALDKLAAEIDDQVDELDTSTRREEYADVVES